MTKSKKITIILCSILFAFVGFFGVFLANHNDSVVKADTVDTNYQFNTSGFYIPYSYFTAENATSVDTSSPGYSGFVNIKFFFGYADNGTSRGSLNVSQNTNNEFLPTAPGNNIYIRYDSSRSSSVANYINFNPYGDGGNWSQHFGYILNTNRYFAYTWNLSSSNFNFNIVRYTVSSNVGGFWGQSSLNEYRFTFFDNNNNSLAIHFASYSGYLRDNMMLQNRTYYVVSSFSDNDYFQTGYDNGYNVGYSDGTSSGYDNGYNVGYSDGDSAGYNRGVESANDYTFLGLIGATIDAPINAFTSFFDFELLGVNLKDFFFAILTFALVIVIVRFALAR